MTKLKVEKQAENACQTESNLISKRNGSPGNQFADEQDGQHARDPHDEIAGSKKASPPFHRDNIGSDRDPSGKRQVPNESRVTESAIAAQMTACPPTNIGNKARPRIASRAIPPPNAIVNSLRWPKRSTRIAPGSRSNAELKLENELIRPTCARVAPEPGCTGLHT